MAADPLNARIARLEGSYEQMDRRMADLHAELSATRVELGNRIDRVGARVDMVLYGVALAILVPIFLRVFFR